jgi:hypothetical protein
MRPESLAPLLAPFLIAGIYLAVREALRWWRRRQ